MVAIRYSESREETFNLKSRSEGGTNKTFLDQVVIQPKHQAILDLYSVVRI